MKTKYTPGPWKYAGYNGTHSFDSIGRCIADAPRPTGVSDEEGVANAKLIAAAPDLLEALRRLLDERYVCGSEDDQEFDEHGNFTCNSPASIAARAAIAKALN